MGSIEILEDLQKSANPITPTVSFQNQAISNEISTVVASKAAQISEQQVTKYQEDKGSKKLGFVPLSGIIASVIGVSVIGSFWLLRPQNVISQSQIQDTVTRMTPEPQPAIKSTENNFYWLSSRRVTDADLEGMNGYTLDVMRNYIFARHGRRFNNPGLQEYFDKQTWYTPKYLPQDFPSNLLSDLERDNVNYISMYQDKTNKRFFMK